ncbi:unnamed protein product [Brassica rapa subsp. trilocularis]
MAASGSDRDSGNNAIHHKTLAESKFNSGDLTSALNHARKALALFPDTEGVSSMVTASDGDTPEWYKILKVEPFSHIDTIKEQYRKLALVLRPDENPYAGCEEGFRLVNEAFEVLSDKVRRSEYDMKLRIRVQGEIGACDGETSTFSNGACSSKIITYTRRRKRVGEGNESLRRVSEGGETREEEAKALDRHERLDEEDEGMMTLAEMQSVLKRKKPKVKITERSSTIVSREEHDISSGDETLMEMSTNKEKEALKNKSNKKKKKTNRKELSEVVDLEYVSGVNRKRDRGKLNQENYMALADEDCELYDFDKDRMPRSFKKGQVWAVYDGGDDEKMPRSYCLVSEVVSLNPFKVWITWLDFESEKLISWVKISSCGRRFRVSEKALVEQAKPFSHVVNCERFHVIGEIF